MQKKVVSLISAAMMIAAVGFFSSCSNDSDDSSSSSSSQSSQTGETTGKTYTTVAGGTYVSSIESSISYTFNTDKTVLQNAGGTSINIGNWSLNGQTVTVTHAGQETLKFTANSTFTTLTFSASGAATATYIRK